MPYYNLPWPRPYYHPPCGTDATVDGVNEVLALKRQSMRDRDYFLSCQRECGRVDVTAARFFREEAANCLHTYRACCYVLSQIMSDPPGDCRGVKVDASIGSRVDLILQQACCA